MVEEVVDGRVDEGDKIGTCQHGWHVHRWRMNEYEYPELLNERFTRSIALLLHSQHIPILHNT